VPFLRKCRKLLYSRKAIYDNIIGHMRFACYITKAKNTKSEYVIFNDFPMQQRLHERTSISRSTYTALLFCSNIKYVFRFIVRKVLKFGMSHKS